MARPPQRELIGSLVRFVLAAVAPQPQAALGIRLWLGLAAGIGGAAAMICFSIAALALLEPRLTLAGACGLLGLFYTLATGLFYLVASRR